MNWSVPNGELLLSEAIDGQEPLLVRYPDGLALYKRGECDDRVMYLDLEAESFDK